MLERRLSDAFHGISYGLVKHFHSTCIFIEPVVDPVQPGLLYGRAAASRYGEVEPASLVIVSGPEDEGLEQPVLIAFALSSVHVSGFFGEWPPARRVMSENCGMLSFCGALPHPARMIAAAIMIMILKLFISGEVNLQ